MNHRQIFIYCYENERNYWLSHQYSVIGFKDSDDFLPNKISKIKKGDIILIRDSNVSAHLELFGGCLAKGNVYEHRVGEKYDYPDLIWDEETTFNKVIYTLRLPVDFVSLYLKKEIDWEEFLKINQCDSKGLPMDIKQIKVFTKGNFYSPEYYDSLIKILSIKFHNAVTF